MLVLAAAGTAGTPFGMASGQWLLRMGLVSAGFAGALIGVSLTLVLAGGGRRPTVLLLAGVVVGVLLGAIANLMMLVSPEALRGGQAFMLGSTGFLGWHALAPLAVVLFISLPIAVRYSRALDALVLGEATAQSLGVAVPRVRLLLVALMALCTGTAVAETGLVAFVGLVAPHLVRRSVIVTHGGLLVLATLAGGVLLLGADVVARSVLAPQELPVGLLTTILGGMYLLVLLHRRAADDSDECRAPRPAAGGSPIGVRAWQADDFEGRVREFWRRRVDGGGGPQRRRQEYLAVAVGGTPAGPWCRASCRAPDRILVGARTVAAADVARSDSGGRRYRRP